MGFPLVQILIFLSAMLTFPQTESDFGVPVQAFDFLAILVRWFCQNYQNLESLQLNFILLNISGEFRIFEVFVMTAY